MTTSNLLKFITRHIREEPDVRLCRFDSFDQQRVVVKQADRSYTLMEIFSMLNLPLEHFTLDSLSVAVCGIVLSSYS